MKNSFNKTIKQIQGFLIEKECPELVAVLKKASYHNSLCMVIFTAYPEFKLEADLDDDDFLMIESKKTNIPPYGAAWEYGFIERYIPLLARQGNLIYFIQNYKSSNSLLFKDKTWDFAYYCYDELWVELFTTSKSLADKIRNTFNCQRIEYPGSIKKPGGIIVDV